MEHPPFRERRVQGTGICRELPLAEIRVFASAIPSSEKGRVWYISMHRRSGSTGLFSSFYRKTTKITTDAGMCFAVRNAQKNPLYTVHFRHSSKRKEAASRPANTAVMPWICGRIERDSIRISGGKAGPARNRGAARHPRPPCLSPKPRPRKRRRIPWRPMMR